MSSSACRGDAVLGLDRRPRLDGWTEVPKLDESQTGLVGAEVGHRIALDLDQLSAVLVDRVEDVKRDAGGWSKSEREVSLRTRPLQSPRSFEGIGWR
jgi:hypothetical protein